VPRADAAARRADLVTVCEHVNVTFEAAVQAKRGGAAKMDE
jgi:hypothetical protein